MEELHFHVLSPILKYSILKSKSSFSVTKSFEIQNKFTSLSNDGENQFHFKKKNHTHTPFSIQNDIFKHFSLLLHDIVSTIQTPILLCLWKEYLSTNIEASLIAQTLVAD